MTKKTKEQTLKELKAKLKTAHKAAQEAYEEYINLKRLVDKELCVSNLKLIGRTYEYVASESTPQEEKLSREYRIVTGITENNTANVFYIKEGPDGLIDCIHMNVDLPFHSAWKRCSKKKWNDFLHKISDYILTYTQ